MAARPLLPTRRPQLGRDNTAARHRARGPAGPLPAHAASSRIPHITGIPYLADPVLLGVRHQPAGHRPGLVPLHVHDRDAAVFFLLARTVSGDPDQHTVLALRAERL